MALDEDWRQNAQEMLDEGRVDAAIYVMQDTGNRINEIEDPTAQVNTLRYLGELYQQVGKPAIATEKFKDAMKRSLEITPIWKAFSAAVSVLEMHRKAVKNHQGLSILLQDTLDRKMLTAAARDTQTKEVGRYIQCFAGAGTQSQILMILNELREINQPWLRKHALFAMTKIEIKPDAIFGREPKPNPHYDADVYEKFLWQFLMATLHRSKNYSAQYQEYFASAKKLAEEVPTEQRHQAKAMLRKMR